MSKPSENPRKALGKGLTALLPSRTVARSEVPPERPGAVSRLVIGKIEANPLQPRTHFDPDALEELAQSIRANGIIQPLVVRKQGDRYQLVAGERRWRAAKIAGLAEVPVVVQDIPDERLLEITLIENIQREDLNPIETAQAFERLAHDLQLSHDQIAERTGKERSTITNMLRLLRLPPDIQRMVADRKLSGGHARALLTLPNEEIQRDVATRAAAQEMSVRQIEKLVQHLARPEEAKPEETPVPVDPNVKAALQELERVLGTRVRLIQKSEKRGRIEIEYYSPEDLDRIYSLIVKES